MAHFYLTELLEAAAPGSPLEMTGAEARHMVRVSRVRSGEVLRVGNGRGLVATGTVVRADAEGVLLEVTESKTVPAPTRRLMLAQALAKQGRDEQAVQAATELGVDVVIPWAASRSIVRWDGPKRDKGRARWEAIVREATKQSIRAWLPEVREPVTTGDLADSARSLRMLVLEPTAAEAVTAVRPDDRDIMLVVGPEGGIAPEELERLCDAGAEPVRLGDTVLRTSTAGPAAIAVLNGLLGRW